MLLVLIFQILLLSLVGIVYRHVGAALRMEAAQSAQNLRNEGVLHALARGISLLETGLPPSNPYECARDDQYHVGRADLCGHDEFGRGNELDASTPRMSNQRRASIPCRPRSLRT